ncbi:hypothetical protein B4080_3292 [Bacillus cereus]|nr:hypothetical protein B4080_3292 [Bacillus cereus]
MKQDETCSYNSTTIKKGEALDTTSPFLVYNESFNNLTVCF